MKSFFLQCFNNNKKAFNLLFQPEPGEQVPDGRPCRQTEHHQNIKKRQVKGRIEAGVRRSKVEQVRLWQSKVRCEQSKAKRPKVRGGTIEFTCNSPLPTSFPCTARETRLISSPRAMLPGPGSAVLQETVFRQDVVVSRQRLIGGTSPWLRMGGHQCTSHFYTSAPEHQCEVL